MPTESVLIVIGAAIIVNLVIMAAFLVTFIARRRQRFATPDAFVEPSAYRLAQATDTPASVAPVGRGMDPASTQPNSKEEGPIMSSSEPTDISRFRAVMTNEGERAEETIATFLSSQADDQPEPLARDPQSGLDGPMTWETRVREEDARHVRYGRPVSVVLVELDGLDRLVDRFGPDAADRLIPPVGQTLQRQGRAVDHIARLGSGRFAVLLPETDEVQAINYVERVRAECDRWLAAGAVAMRLAIGWASPLPGSDLGTAVRVADERLNADRRRPASISDVPAPPPEAVPPALTEEKYPAPGPLPMDVSSESPGS